jgi:hypothetical protein
MILRMQSLGFELKRLNQPENQHARYALLRDLAIRARVQSFEHCVYFGLGRVAAQYRQRVATLPGGSDPFFQYGQSLFYTG